MAANEGGAEPVNAWLIRAGQSGERDSFVLENGVAGGGFKEVGDLTTATTRQAVSDLVRQSSPDATEGRINNFAGQLWALRDRINPKDLVVLPLKTTGQIAIGEVTGGYQYLKNDDTSRRHVIPVNWIRTDVPRTAVHQDLLYSLGAFMTICGLKRNDAAWRIAQIAKTGHDPGARPDSQSSADAAEEDDVVSTSGVEIERAAMDRIQGFIAERFMGHGLARLVGAVLTAEGYVCQVGEPGPDGGIDVFAGRGPLGLDSPRLIVQVKSSPTPVEAKVVRELQGVVATHGADQALLVAWGGVNKVAKQELKGQFFKVRVWSADDFVEALMAVYPDLDEDVRKDVPLKQIWSLVEDAE